jgi:L-ascorbate metabolism protein UlaG (beta-lactamase superfamily)
MISAQEILLSDREVADITEKVFKNECDSNDEYLMQWNEGEDFLSLGIGHFIWYPKRAEGPFRESFPDYLRFAEECGEDLPEWLKESSDPDCPWGTREDFLDSIDGSRARGLKEFLIDSKVSQGAFIIKRMEEALPSILKKLPSEEHGLIRDKFYKVASTPSGVYALVDYINFKGLGVHEPERYKGEGWGLLQVLKGMDAGGDVEDFSRSAKAALKRRIANSPKERNEARWLPGWEKRIDTYTQKEVSMQIKFIPIEHASFVMTSEAVSIYVDPVGGIASYKGIAPPDIILITHTHFDHLDAGVVKGLRARDTVIIGPRSVTEELGFGQTIDNGRKKSVKGVDIEALPMYNTTKDRLQFHKKGDGNGYVVTLDKKRIYISGDTEDIPEMRALKNIDYAFLCVNLPYTMTVDQAAGAALEFRPKAVFPYHYKGSGGMSDLERFKELVSKDKTIEVRVLDWY